MSRSFIYQHLILCAHESYRLERAMRRTRHQGFPLKSGGLQIFGDCKVSITKTCGWAEQCYITNYIMSSLSAEHFHPCVWNKEWMLAHFQVAQDKNILIWSTVLLMNGYIITGAVSRQLSQLSMSADAMPYLYNNWNPSFVSIVKLKKRRFGWKVVEKSFGYKFSSWTLKLQNIYDMRIKFSLCNCCTNAKN